MKYLLVIFLVLPDSGIIAQNKTDSTALYYTLAAEENIIIGDSAKYSKKLAGFHNYQPQLRFGDFFQQQSNLGHALRPLDRTTEDFARLIDQDVFFSDAYAPYLWAKNNIRYYTSLKPFTDLYYVMGAKKEQYFKILHAQPLASNLYFSVEHKVLNSPGSYQHHLSNHESPAINLRYHTLNNKYHVLATYFHNKVEVDDHGGINRIEYFTDSATYNDRELIPVNLQESRILVKGGGVHLRQEYYPAADTNRLVDSTAVSFYHDFFYRKDSYRYQDGGNTSGFYPGMQDVGFVEDSLAVKHLTNKVGARFNISKISFDVQLGHEYYDVWQNQKDTFLNAIVPAVSSEFSENGWFIRLEGESSFFQKRQEWNVSGLFSKKFQNYKLRVKAGLLNAIPAVLQERYYSTYYQWDKEFQETYLTYASGEFTNSFLNASVAIYDFSNYIYFDPLGMPRQDDGSFQLFQVKANPTVKWNDITLDNTLIYQDILGNDFLRLPEYMARHQLYYSFNLFGKVLKTQAGLQLTYHSPFYGHQYVPATQVFALQNEQRIGNYPYVDVFANFYIKRARIFVSYNHLNALLEDHSYFLMPGYPMRDEAFHFGVSWMFYD